MFEDMFREIGGRRRGIVIALFTIALFGIVVYTVEEVLGLAFPSRIGHDDANWILLAIGFIAIAIIACILRSFRFLSLLSTIAAALVFLLMSCQLILGKAFADVRMPAMLVGVLFVVIYFLLMKLARRLMKSTRAVAPKPME
jgi:hypothetical protein